MMIENFLTKKTVMGLSRQYWNRDFDHWWKKLPSEDLSKEKIKSIFKKLDKNGFVYLNTMSLGYVEFRHMEDYLSNMDSVKCDLIFDITEWPEKIAIEFWNLKKDVYQKISNFYSFTLKTENDNYFANNEKTGLYVHTLNMDIIDDEVDVAIKLMGELRSMRKERIQKIQKERKKFL
jgi:hypothetical protein